jgi:hypothetical protein
MTETAQQSRAGRPLADRPDDSQLRLPATRIGRSSTRSAAGLFGSTTLRSGMWQLDFWWWCMVNLDRRECRPIVERHVSRFHQPHRAQVRPVHRRHLRCRRMAALDTQRPAILVLPGPQPQATCVIMPSG